MPADLIAKIRQYPKTAAFVLGSLSVLALPPHFWLPVLLVSFTGLLLLLQQTEKPKEAFAFGYWFGFGYFACGLSWIGNALLIDAQTFGWLYPLVFLASGAFFGLFAAFPAWLASYFKNIYAKYLAFASLWVAFEWVRSFFLTGFPWNLLGTVLAFTPATMQLAAVIGTYGLSLLVIMISSAPALALRQKDKIGLWSSLGLIITGSLLIGGYGVFRLHRLGSTEDGDIKVRIVQPAIPQTMKWSPTSLDDNINKYIAMSRTEGLEDVDFVIWGETASPFPLDYDDYYRQLVTNAIPEKGYLITGLVRYEADADDRYQPLNSLFVMNKHGIVRGSYDKSHLVPFGEYIPLRRWLPLWIRPITNTIANFKAGSGLKNIRIDDYPEFGALICYEIIFPAQVVNSKHKPDWLVNLTNDGWYGNSAGPYQHLAMAQMRAVEEGITVVRVANTGVSAVIDRLGIIRTSLPLNHSGTVDTFLPKKLSTPTLYGKYSNFIPLILCFLNLTFAFMLKRRFR